MEALSAVRDWAQENALAGFLIGAIPGWRANATRRSSGQRAALFEPKGRPNPAITPNDNRNSLLFRDSTLLPRNISLLIGVGNYLRSGCGAALSGSRSRLRAAEIADFPVKFPVSRVSVWRPVRSALRRQPGIGIRSGDCRSRSLEGTRRDRLENRTD